MDNATPSCPAHLLSALETSFVPGPTLWDWCKATFLDPSLPMFNEEHQHLTDAKVGILWTNVENVKKGRMVVGTAELGKTQGSMGKWPRARAEQQVFEWFGETPDFIITIYAPWWDQATDLQRCALLEHEMLHCAQAKDQFGMPKFNRSTGRPSFTLIDHDVQEFIGVVRRYGVVSEDVRELVEAANTQPEIGLADIKSICGNCK